MATVNGILRTNNYESITSNSYTVEPLVRSSAQPQKMNDWGFQIDIPYPLSVSAGTYRAPTTGENPMDGAHRNVFVRDARPKQKFFFQTARSGANGRSVEPQTADYAGDRTFY